MAFQAPVHKKCAWEVMDAAARLRLALHVHDQEWRGIRVVSHASLVAAVSSFRGVKPRSAFDPSLSNRLHCCCWVSREYFS
jgi:hypothetical protein